MGVCLGATNVDLFEALCWKDISVGIRTSLVFCLPFPLSEVGFVLAPTRRPEWIFLQEVPFLRGFKVKPRGKKSHHYRGPTLNKRYGPYVPPCFPTAITFPTGEIIFPARAKPNTSRHSVFQDAVHQFTLPNVTAASSAFLI